MAGFVEELIDESLGASSKRWALMLVALGAGALAAVWISGRGRSRPAGTAPPSPEPTPSEPAPIVALAGRAVTQAGSAWTRVSTPPAVLRKALGRSGSPDHG